MSTESCQNNAAHSTPLNQAAEQDNHRYIVYKHTNIANGKVYIGMTRNSIEQRSGKNGRNYKKNPLFNKAIEKYGWNNFKHEVLYDGLTLSEASKIEQRLIGEYRSNNARYGYNLSSGGEGGNTGCHASEELRRLQSQRNKGKKNYCFGKFGKDHPAFGHRFTAEERAYFSAVQKGKIVSDKTREKLSDAKKKIGAWVGEKNPMSGKKYGSAPQARPVVCIETGELFDSVKRAAESIGVTPTTLTATCKGKNQTSKGLHWAYAEDRGFGYGT